MEASPRQSKGVNCEMRASSQWVVGDVEIRRSRPSRDLYFSTPSFWKPLEGKHMVDVIG